MRVPSSFEVRSAFRGLVVQSPAPLFVLLLAVAAAAAPSSPPPSVSSLPAPLSFASAPLPLPGTDAAACKQAVAMLRRFEAVQSAEVYLTGAGSGLRALRVIVKTQPGRPLTAPVLGTMVELLDGSLPGVGRQGLTIADTTGRLLWAQGAAMAAESKSPGRPWWWPAGLALLVVGGAVGLLWRGRRSRPAPAEVRRVVAMLACERPEVAALALTLLPEATAARARHALRRRGLEIPEHAPAVKPLIRQALSEMLRSRLSSP